MKKNKKVTNEIRILREFVEEFAPIQDDVDNMGYWELVTIVKEIAKEL